MKKYIIFFSLFFFPLFVFATTTVEFPNLLGNATFGGILSKLLIIAMWFGAVILTGLVVWSAYVLMFSKGDPAEIKKAKAMLLYGVIGYVILLFADAIRLIILNLLA
ncbi:MAG: hypothetical protein WC842_01255 [Candidatus Paceibacterota bacterium]|jgi:hypothetical protein